MRTSKLKRCTNCYTASALYDLPFHTIRTHLYDPYEPYNTWQYFYNTQAINPSHSVPQENMRKCALFDGLISGLADIGGAILGWDYGNDYDYDDEDEEEEIEERQKEVKGGTNANLKGHINGSLNFGVTGATNMEMKGSAGAINSGGNTQIASSSSAVQQIPSTGIRQPQIPSGFGGNSNVQSGIQQIGGYNQNVQNGIGQSMLRRLNSAAGTPANAYTKPHQHRYKPMNANSQSDIYQYGDRNMNSQTTVIQNARKQQEQLQPMPVHYYPLLYPPYVMI